MKDRKRNEAGRKPVAVNGAEVLYGTGLPATRGGHLYGAFPYPTKISPEAIALFIAAHTKPGDTVFDGFAGSGTTGLAALLCEDPPAHLREEAKRLGLDVQWGVRNAVLYELGALGSFVSQTLTNPPDPTSFRKAAEEILKAAEKEEGWMYAAACPKDDKQGTIRYVIWSDLLCCPKCKCEVTMWDSCVSRDPAQIGPNFACPSCSEEVPMSEVERLTQTVRDDLIGKRVKLRARKPVWVYGTSGKQNWSRAATVEDVRLLDRIAREPVPTGIPRVEIPWGDLYRRGYHQGITHLHQFYTRRNLIIFGRLWEQTERHKGELRDALRFWLLSYNASHATIMTRVVAKSGQKDLVVTSAQPGVLYVSGLPVEKNLISGLKRKLSTIGKAFGIIRGRKGRIEVYQRSCRHVDLPAQSVDYVFTDPPFGGNIPYAELSFLNEAWLNRYTDRTEEAIISDDQKKTVLEYQELLTGALAENHRILKHNGKATLIFHSATAEVWNALQAAYRDAGFNVESAGILDKTQGSFKQVTAAGAVRGDPVLLLGKQLINEERATEDVWKVAAKLRKAAASTLDPVEQSAHRLYSRLVTHYLAHDQQVPLDADSFYRWHADQAFSEATAVARK